MPDKLLGVRPPCSATSPVVSELELELELKPELPVIFKEDVIGFTFSILLSLHGKAISISSSRQLSVTLCKR